MGPASAQGGHEGGGAHGAAALAAELLAERRALGGALQELEAMCDEAAEQPECWRAAFPAKARRSLPPHTHKTPSATYLPISLAAKGVHAVLAALRAMLDALGAMHTALRSLDPGRAGTSSMLLLLQA